MGDTKTASRSIQKASSATIRSSVLRLQVNQLRIDIVGLDFLGSWVR